MSAQINLYHPRFLKQRELYTLRNVAIAATALYAVIGLGGVWAWQDADALRESATAAEQKLKVVKAKVEAETKAAAQRKPSAQLAAEAENAELLARRRIEIAALLESGAVGSTGGFADYMRGFARQTQDGLWLTGFTIGSGGNEMEIRGSMLSQGALPDYIRRLGGEKAFQGRNFASLTMNRVEPAPVAGQPATAAQGPAPVRPIDFVLMPNKTTETREARR